MVRSGPPLQLVLVGDHNIVIDGLERLLRFDRRVKVVGHARSLSAARVLLEHLTPHVIVLDLRLPDSVGAGSMLEVRRLCPAARLLVLTGGAAVDERAARRGGADAFLRRETAPERILETIESWLPAGAPPQPPEQRSRRASSRSHASSPKV
jgi:DNA-binding NarL/FixJ family response regulator